MNDREELKKHLAGICPPLQNLGLRAYQDILADFITEQTRLAREELLTNIENALLDRSIGLTNEETAVKWDDIQAVLAQLAPKPEKGPENE
jgi:hypothetical protein